MEVNRPAARTNPSPHTHVGQPSPMEIGAVGDDSHSGEQNKLAKVEDARIEEVARRMVAAVWNEENAKYENGYRRQENAGGKGKSRDADHEQVRGSAKGKGKGNVRSPVKCFVCDRVGHPARLCPVKEKFLKKCQTCGGAGHSAEFCPSGKSS